MKQTLLKWLVATGSGALVASLMYITGTLGAIELDMTTTEGLLLATVVTGVTKLLGWLVAMVKV